MPITENTRSTMCMPDDPRVVADNVEISDVALKAARPGGTPTTSLALDYLTLGPRLQSRELKTAVVKEYAKALRRGEIFPPVRVVRDGRDRYYLVDGYHRVAATHERNGIDTIAAEIIDGTFNDALWYSWAANRDHGLRRTQKEKRGIIRAALQHPQWSKKSNRAIPRHVGCDHKTVAAIRRFLTAGEIPKRRPKAGPRAPRGSFKRSVLRACWLLAEIPPERACQFDAMDLPVVKAGYETLRRLLFDAPSQPAVEKQSGDRSQGGECLARTKRDRLMVWRSGK
jgi:hypothetical protein